MLKIVSACVAITLTALPTYSATLSVQGIVGLSGIDAQTGLASGGTDNQSIGTNNASSGASGAVTANVTGSYGNGTAYASANLSTGQIKASVGGSAGTYYTNILTAPVIGQELSVVASSVMSDTFTVSGTGTVRFDLAYDGFWDLSPQPYLSCCDSFGNPVAGTFSPMWFAFGSLTLGSNGVVAGDQFAFSHSTDPLTGAASGVLSISATLIDGFTYGISAALDVLMNYASGTVDFANTATLSYFASPGVTLTFSDPLFLSVDPNAPAPVPLPAGVFLLGAGLIALGALRRRKQA
ncbi:MAG: hypothetical protein RLZZ528_128 [Pseudomonadota bacterium]